MEPHETLKGKLLGLSDTKDKKRSAEIDEKGNMIDMSEDAYNYAQQAIPYNSKIEYLVKKDLKNKPVIIHLKPVFKPKGKGRTRDFIPMPHQQFELIKNNQVRRSQAFNLAVDYHKLTGFDTSKDELKELLKTSKKIEAYILDVKK
ncbi:MAG: hypothetical protein V3U92_19785 [Cellulophaga sp.]